MRKAKSNDSSPQKQLKAIKRKLVCPSYTTKESTLTGRYQHSIIVNYNSRIRSFSNVDIKNDCSFIDLSLNNLSNFVNFPSSLLNLTTLILDSNQIRSFQGILSTNTYPKLRFLSLKKNPIAQNTYFKTMCLIVFGSQLHTINGEKITDALRQSANKQRKLILPYLIQGKIVTNLNPPKFSDPLSEKAQIGHTIGHADNKNSPNSKIKHRKMSPRNKLSSKSDQLPSVGCLVNMISRISVNQIEKVIENQIERDNNDLDESKKSLLNAVIEIKQKINHLKTKFNENDKFDVDEKIFSESHQNDEQINSENDSSIKEQRVTKKQKVIKKQIINDEQDNSDNQINKIEPEIFDDHSNNDVKKIFDDHSNNDDRKIFDDNELIKNEINSQSIQAQIHQKEDTKKIDISSLKIIEDPSINNDVEMCFDYPESCPFLILDFE